MFHEVCDLKEVRDNGSLSFPKGNFLLTHEAGNFMELYGENIMAGSLERVGRLAARAIKENRPLFVRLTPRLIKDAREWVGKNFGSEVERNLSDEKVVEMYLNPNT